MSLHQKEYVAQSLENQGKLSAQRALADPIDLSTYATPTLLKDVATCSHLHLDSPSIQVAQSHNKANEDAASKLKLLPPPRVFGDSTSDQLSILNHLIPNQNDPQSQKESNDLMEWAVKWTKDLLAGVISLNQEEKDIIGNQELFGGLKSEQGRRQLVVDVVTVRIGGLVLPNLRPSGYFHCSTSVSLAGSTSGLIAHAKRLVLLAKLQDISSSRVCVRIPSTLAGLKASNGLEKSNIRTLCTAIFSVEQGLAAAESSNATYVSPWVRSLSSHFYDSHNVPTVSRLYDDAAPGIQMVKSLQVQIRRRSVRSRVMASSFLTPIEAMQVCGIDNLTLSPSLLSELAVKPLTGTMREIRDKSLESLTVYDAEEDPDEPDNEFYHDGEKRGPLSLEEEDVNDAGDGKGGWFDEQSAAGMRLKKALESERVKWLLNDALTILGKAESDLRDLVALKMIEDLEGMRM